MKLFGITGGIGSGKSFICEGLIERGYAVYSSDDEAKRIMCHNTMVRSQIELLFGSDIYQGDVLNRQQVAQQIFHDSTIRHKINHIVHPAVRFDLEHWAKRQSDICFVESAILFESGLDSLCEATICVTADEELRIKRVMQRDGVSREQVLARLHAQITEQERKEKSNLVIINDENQPISALCFEILEFCRNFAG